MTSLVRCLVYQLNQIKVIQQILQRVNITVGGVIKMKVKITNKHQVTSCVTVLLDQYWKFVQKSFVGLDSFCLFAGRRPV